MSAERYIPATCDELAIGSDTARKFVNALLRVGLEHGATRHELLQAAMQVGLSEDDAGMFVDRVVSVRDRK